MSITDDKYLVFDVETPNMANDKICSIGISEIECGQIIRTQNILLNPECEFDSMNIHIHGITEQDILDKSTFPSFWKEWRPLFFDRVIIAHNACFDLSVLRKTLISYEFTEPSVYYIDTVKLARKVYPELQNYKLDTLCKHLGIKLDHHNSGSDCTATAELFLDICKHGLKLADFISSYALGGNCSKDKSTPPRKKLSSESQMLLELQSVLKEITADGQIDASEMNHLRYWIDQHSELAGNYPYDSLYHQIEVILEDGIIENNELDILLELCNKLIDPLGACTCNHHCIDVDGKNVVLSGEFSIGSKAEVESILVNRGATVQKSVTSKTNIVLVGNQGNNSWAAGNYGTKIKKAMELQQKGAAIEIIKESDYFSSEV